MGKTTISVEDSTHRRFISNKGMAEGIAGKTIESDEFLNTLLDLNEKANEIAKTILSSGKSSAEMGGLANNG